MPCSVPANTARMQLELFFVPSFSQTGNRLPLSSQKRAEGKKSDNKPWSYLGVLQGKFREAEQARQKGIKTIETPSKADDPVGKLAELHNFRLQPPQELHFYLDTFRKGGMHHPLNYYRNRRICFDEEQGTPEHRLRALRLISIYRHQARYEVPCFCSRSLHHRHSRCSFAAINVRQKSEIFRKGWLSQDSREWRWALDAAGELIRHSYGVAKH